jgi:hypothetical protein
MSSPRRGRTTLAEPAVVLDRDSTTPPSGGDSDPPPDPPPLYVRALDAFEAFYRQLGVVSQCMAELRAAFDAKPVPFVVLVAADLNSALGVLYARLELLEVVTNDDAGRELWTHPMMELMRSQLRALLEHGTVYASRHPDDCRVLQQLRHLAVTLAAEAKVRRQVVGDTRMPDGHTGDGHTGDMMGDHLGPGQRVAVILDPSGLRIRCRMRRPWRRPAWRRGRRLELP